MEKVKIRIPTSQEWGKMMNICSEDNERTHWKDMYTWVDDQERYPDAESSLRAYRGGDWAGLWDYSNASTHGAVGFRPAFEGLTSDAQDGDIAVVGTLYMDGQPVKVPTNPVWIGDIMKYQNNTKLELREPLDDPAYQVKAIKVGNIFIADRVLLSKISYNEILKMLSEC